METASIKPEDFKKLMRNVELIKRVLVDERELTDWAEEQLEKARKTPESEYISHEEVKKRILSKK